MNNNSFFPKIISKLNRLTFTYIILTLKIKNAFSINRPH